MMILGVDPGTIKMGYSLLEIQEGKMSLEDYGTVSLPAKMTIGQAQGAVLIAAASAKIPVSRYTPSKIKSSVVGYGNASKEAVQDVVFNLFGIKDSPSDDATDAIAIAVCHALSSRAQETIENRIIN